jgi:hypothetical protein
MDGLSSHAKDVAMCPAVSDLLPKRCERIEVRVAGLTQLFHAMDPSKLRYRDLDPDAEAFITDWAREVPSSLTLGLTVLVEGKSGLSAEPGELREAIGGFFCRRAALARRRLRDLFHRGRTSLFIGVGALACSMTAGDVLGRAFSHHVTDLVREGLLIGGWVAMWRPMEIFFYDQWPIRADVTLADRLSSMPVQICYAPSADPACPNGAPIEDLGDTAELVCGE